MLALHLVKQRRGDAILAAVEPILRRTIEGVDVARDIAPVRRTRAAPLAQADSSGVASAASRSMRAAGRRANWGALFITGAI